MRSTLFSLVLLPALLSGCAWFDDDEPGDIAAPVAAAPAETAAASAPPADAPDAEDSIPSASGAATGSTESIPSASGRLSGSAGPIPPASGSGSAVPVGDERPAHRVRGRTLASGGFRGLGEVPVSGSVAVIDLGTGVAVSFASDFRAEGLDPGEITVGLGRGGTYVSEGDLGPLKKADGSQFYLVPIRIDVTAFGEVYLVDREALRPLAVAEITAVF